METNLGSVDEKMDGVIEGRVKERHRMNEAQRRTNGGRSDVCTIEESTEGGNERMTNDQKVGRHEGMKVIEEMEIEVR